MTKDKLQQELLAKIKGGIKPSDLKKKTKKPSPKTVSPPPIEINKDNNYQSDEGYESDQSDKIPTAPPLPNQNLLNQISSLKKRLTTYQDFKEVDLKIKEQYKQEIADMTEEMKQKAKTLTELQKTIAQLQQKITEQDKSIAELKNQAKTTENINPEPNEPQETKTFTCSDCQQEKPQSELSRAFNNFSFCLECSKKARKQAQTNKTNPEPQPQSFTCVVCEEPKQEIPTHKKVDISYKTHLVKGKEYPVCSTCLPHLKEYNEHEDQEFSIGED